MTIRSDTDLNWHLYLHEFLWFILLVFPSFMTTQLDVNPGSSRHHKSDCSSSRFAPSPETISWVLHHWHHRQLTPCPCWARFLLGQPFCPPLSFSADVSIIRNQACIKTLQCTSHYYVRTDDKHVQGCQLDQCHPWASLTLKLLRKWHDWRKIWRQQITHSRHHWGEQILEISRRTVVNVRTHYVHFSYKFGTSLIGSTKTPSFVKLSSTT